MDPPPRINMLILRKGEGHTDDWEPVRKVFRKCWGSKKLEPPPCATSHSQLRIPPPISGGSFPLLPCAQDQKRTEARQRVAVNDRRHRYQLSISSSDSGFPSRKVAGLFDSQSTSMTDIQWDSATDCGMTSQSESEPEYCKYAYKNDSDSVPAPTGNGHQKESVLIRNCVIPGQFSL